MKIEYDPYVKVKLTTEEAQSILAALKPYKCANELIQIRVNEFADLLDDALKFPRHD